MEVIPKYPTAWLQKLFWGCQLCGLVPVCPVEKSGVFSSDFVPFLTKIRTISSLVNFISVSLVKKNILPKVEWFAQLNFFRHHRSRVFFTAVLIVSFFAKTLLKMPYFLKSRQIVALEVELLVAKELWTTLILSMVVFESIRTFLTSFFFVFWSSSLFSCVLG